MENIIALVVTEKIKGFVYKLYNKNDTAMFYIGSCTGPLKIRMQKHKTASIKSPSKLYKYIRDNEGFENFSSEILEIIEVDNIKELRQKEQDFFNLLKPSLNCNVAKSNIGIDYKTDKKLYMKLYMKLYSQTEKSKSYQKKYYQNYKKEKLNL